MSFPIDCQKTFCWFPAGKNEKPLVKVFLRMAADELQRMRASHIEVQDETIQFTVALFRWVSGWNLLSCVDKGSIEITPSVETFCVTYYLSFKRMFVVDCVICFLAISFITLPAPGLSLTLKLSGPIVLFLAVYALHYLITVTRFSRFIKRIFARANYQSRGT